MRALLRGLRNLEAVHGEPDDPHLPAGGVDAVLIANTFHELSDQELILGRAKEAPHRHQSPDSAQARLRQTGFEIVSRDDRFVDGSSHGRWWLIVARKP